MGVMAVGQGMPERSNSSKIRLSPVPDAAAPSDMVVCVPRFTDEVEEISTSGTDGKRPVLVKTLPREMFSD